MTATCMTNQGRGHTATEVSPDLLREKHSSCSTIFLDESTLSEPSVIITVQSLAIAIYYHIKNRKKWIQRNIIIILIPNLFTVSLGLFSMPFV
ncbi:cyclin-Y-like protein 1 isoform 1-T1 [Molossus nigricans]